MRRLRWSANECRLQPDCSNPSTNAREHYVRDTHSLDMVSVYLALMGVDFEVGEPTELVDHVRLAGRSIPSRNRLRGRQFGLR
jgi:hypothetical protein